MKIGSPKEVFAGEARVAMTPDSAVQLQKLGYDCLIEAGAGVLAGFTDDQLDEFERILEVLDRDLFQWVMGERPTPPEYDTPLFRDIVAFRDRIEF